MAYDTRLSDILATEKRAELAQAWKDTQAAEDFAPLPAGEYVAHVLSGELCTSRQNNTPGYKLCFKICEGEHVGRRVWHDLWLTPPALPMAKRDLGKLGITAIEQLEQPLPPGIRCKVKVALRRDDDGTEYNRVRSFTVIGIDPPEPPDAFAPAEDAQGRQAVGGDGDDKADESNRQGDEGSGPLPGKPDDAIPV